MEEKSTKSDVERITEAIKADALETCKLKKHSSAIHLMALTNVIGYPIVSVYPVSAKLVAPRELFHGIYLPRDQKDATNVKSTSLYLLWTSDEALDNASWFSPNHFVPFCFRATPIKANMPNDKPPQVKRKTEDENSSGKKKTKLESFWGQTKKKKSRTKKKQQKNWQKNLSFQSLQALKRRQRKRK